MGEKEVLNNLIKAFQSLTMELAYDVELICDDTAPEEKKRREQSLLSNRLIRDALLEYKQNHYPDAKSGSQTLDR